MGGFPMTYLTVNTVLFFPNLEDSVTSVLLFTCLWRQQSGWVLRDSRMTWRVGGFPLTNHEKYFLMDARYERARTIGFRCAADVSTPRVTPHAPRHSAGTNLLQGSFQSPNAFTDVSVLGVRDWIVPVPNRTQPSQTWHFARKNGATRISNVSANGADLSYCTGPQPEVHWR